MNGELKSPTTTEPGWGGDMPTIVSMIDPPGVVCRIIEEYERKGGERRRLIRGTTRRSDFDRKREAFGGDGCSECVGYLAVLRQERKDGVWQEARVLHGTTHPRFEPCSVGELCLRCLDERIRGVAWDLTQMERYFDALKTERKRRTEVADV